MGFAIAEDECANVVVFRDQDAAGHLRFFKQSLIARINRPFASINNVETGFS
jgi:hypothetical protein